MYAKTKEHKKHMADMAAHGVPEAEATELLCMVEFASDTELIAMLYFVRGMLAANEIEHSAAG